MTFWKSSGGACHGRGLRRVKDPLTLFEHYFKSPPLGSLPLVWIQFMFLPLSGSLHFSTWLIYGL